MTPKNHRMIVVSEQNYEILRNAGTITDSFNSVISKLIKAANLDENVAMTRSSLGATPSHQQPHQNDPEIVEVNDK